MAEIKFIAGKENSVWQAGGIMDMLPCYEWTTYIYGPWASWKKYKLFYS